MKFTPVGYYVCGISVRHDEYTPDDDSTDEVAINGLKMMVCSADDWNEQYEETVNEGFTGDWSEFTMCSEGWYMVGGQVQYDETNSAA